MALASYIPTQIGSTVSLLTSFRITIGILLAGSMTRPRIFISTSMVTSVMRLGDSLAHKAVGKALGDPYRHIAARSGMDRLRSREIDSLVLRAAAVHLAPLRVIPLNRCLHNLSYMVGIVRPLDLTLALHKHLQPPAFLFFRHAVGH